MRYDQPLKDTTDLQGGRRRTLDLVAQVRTRNGSHELILIHIELQARPEPEFPWRMFEHYTLLRRRYGMRLLPIVLYISGGKGTEEWEEYREAVLDEWIVRFRFRRPRLRGLKAIEEARGGHPVACALAPLMDRRGADLAELKATSLQGIGVSGLDEARRWELADCVNRYLPLKGEAAQRYQALLGEEVYEVAKRLDYHTWRAQTLAEGRQEGLLTGKQEDILTVVRARFGDMPRDLEQRIASIQLPKALDALLVRASTAADLDEVRAALADSPAAER